MTSTWTEHSWTKLPDGTIDLGPGNWWSLWLLVSPGIREFGPRPGGGIVVTALHAGESVSWLSPTGDVSDVLAALRGMTPKQHAASRQSPTVNP